MSLYRISSNPPFTSLPITRSSTTVNPVTVTSDSLPKRTWGDVAKIIMFVMVVILGAAALAACGLIPPLFAALSWFGVAALGVVGGTITFFVARHCFKPVKRSNPAISTSTSVSSRSTSSSPNPATSPDHQPLGKHPTTLSRQPTRSVVPSSLVPTQQKLDLQPDTIAQVVDPVLTGRPKISKQLTLGTPLPLGSTHKFSSVREGVSRTPHHLGLDVSQVSSPSTQASPQLPGTPVSDHEESQAEEKEAAARPEQGQEASRCLNGVPKYRFSKMCIQKCEVNNLEMQVSSLPKFRADDPDFFELLCTADRQAMTQAFPSRSIPRGYGRISEEMSLEQLTAKCDALSKQMVSILLAHVEDINTLSTFGHSLLDQTIVMNHFDLIEPLIKAGIQVSTKEIVLLIDLPSRYAEIKNRFLPLLCAQKQEFAEIFAKYTFEQGTFEELLEALSNENLVSLKEGGARLASTLIDKFDDSLTVFQFANLYKKTEKLRKQNPEILNPLVKKISFLMDMQFQGGETLLQVAIQKWKDVDLAKALFNQGASPTVKFRGNKSAQELAAELGNTDLVRLFTGVKAPVKTHPAPIHPSPATSIVSPTPFTALASLSRKQTLAIPLSLLSPQPSEDDIVFEPISIKPSSTPHSDFGLPIQAQDDFASSPISFSSQSPVAGFNLSSLQANGGDFEADEEARALRRQVTALHIAEEVEKQRAARGSSELPTLATEAVSDWAL